MSGRLEHLKRNRQFRRVGLLLATVGFVTTSVTLGPSLRGGLFWLFAILGMFLGDIVGPDQDQETISGEEWAVIKRLGPLGFLWVGFWYPYALLFRHRGVSHWPLLGTFTRWLYLVGPLMWLVNYRAPLEETLIAGAGIYVGLLLPDAAHFYEDFMR